MSATAAFARQLDTLAAEFQLSRPVELPETQLIYAEMAQRAYELFQARDGEPGVWEDWFRAARTRIFLTARGASLDS